MGVRSLNNMEDNWDGGRTCGEPLLHIAGIVGGISIIPCNINMIPNRVIILGFTTYVVVIFCLMIPLFHGCHVDGLGISNSLLIFFSTYPKVYRNYLAALVSRNNRECKSLFFHCNRWPCRVATILVVGILMHMLLLKVFRTGPSKLRTRLSKSA